MDEVQPLLLLTSMPQTNEISNAVGNMWNTIEDSKKLIPFVPRSMALVSPPVCLVKWKFKSSLNRCSYTLHATLRIAFWATLATTALRSSWDTVAPILVKPSTRFSLGCGGMRWYCMV